MSKTVAELEAAVAALKAELEVAKAEAAVAKAEGIKIAVEVNAGAAAVKADFAAAKADIADTIDCAKCKVEATKDAVATIKFNVRSKATNAKADVEKSVSART